MPTQWHVDECGVNRFQLFMQENKIKPLHSFIAVGFSLLAGFAQAEPIRVASWNLGWHISTDELSNWIERCGKSYRRDPADGVWKLVPPGAPGATIGWHIKESRARLEGIDLAVMPPCGVYQTASRAGVAVTSASYQQRMRQIASFLAGTVRPDIIAFQEVSGTQAVMEALGPTAGEYQVCSFDGKYKVQRLAFAWRKNIAELAEPCTPVHALSLPDLSAEDRVRPGLQVGLRVRGQLVRFLTVHLKSSCVSPLDGGKLDGNGPKAEACRILQRQVAPLEAALEQLAHGASHVVVLGDFNRNLWHEHNQVAGARGVRSNGSTDLRAPLPADVMTQNLLMEVNDGQPAESQLHLQSLACEPPAVDALCAQTKTTLLKPDERRQLVASTGLGCRNPIGLDHVLVSNAMKPLVVQATKLPLGRLGSTLGPRPDKPDPLLAISDHCPIVLTVDFQ